jgi:hypothetical protein
MRWKLAFRTSPCHVEKAMGGGSSLRVRSSVKELGYKVTEIRTYMNPDTTMLYPLTALGEILSAKPAQT